MNCGCGVGYDADGYHEFFEARIVKAKKDHRCCECRRVILAGEQYEYLSMKYDGDFSTSKTCLGCAAVREAYSCDGGVPIGEFWREMRDHVFPGFRMAGECWERTTARGKAWLIEQWRKWKGLSSCQPSMN